MLRLRKIVVQSLGFAASAFGGLNACQKTTKRLISKLSDVARRVEIPCYHRLRTISTVSWDAKDGSSSRAGVPKTPCGI